MRTSLFEEDFERALNYLGLAQKQQQHPRNINGDDDGSPRVIWGGRCCAHVVGGAVCSKCGNDL